MNKTIVAVSGLDGYVRVPLGKSCVLKLRQADYVAGIEAGKQEARALQQARRETHQQAVQQAQALRWLDEETP